jgi:hypothetical protein
MRRQGIFCGLVLLLGAAPTAAQSIDTLAIRGHTRFLADDLLAGRGTGSEGERIAAAYIVSQLKRLGLRPIGADSSFLLPIPLREAFIDPASSVAVTTGLDGVVFNSGEHFVVNTGGAGAFRDFRGRATFVGRPDHAVAALAGERSMVGRVAVFLGPLGAHAVDIMPALSHAGVAGVVLLVPDAAQFDLYVRSRGASRFYVDADVDDPVWQPQLPVIIAGPEMTSALLGDRDIPATLLDGSATRTFDLGRTLTARIHASSRAVPAANVAAILPGSDPMRRDEIVAFTAHYDHLGISTPDADGDSIYNGFSDNAAGVAMLLAVAESMRDNPPARSVAFLFFTGEERGLLGSSWMAAEPPVPLDRVVGLINLDAGAPPAPPINWRIAGGTDSTLGEVAREVAQRHGWTASLSPASPNSDYWPFLQKGVPSIFIIPGDEWENTTTAERDALRRRWDRYHRADDHWHPDFPFAGLGRYAEIARLIGLEIANAGAAAAASPAPIGR